MLLQQIERLLRASFLAGHSDAAIAGPATTFTGIAGGIGFSQTAQYQVGSDEWNDLLFAQVEFFQGLFHVYCLKG